MQAIVGRFCETPSVLQPQVHAASRRLTQTPYNGVSFRVERLLLALAGSVIFRGGFEGFLEADHVFAGAEAVERFRFALEIFFGIVGRLDRETRASTSWPHSTSSPLSSF